jgi:hypothetical protein
MASKKRHVTCIEYGCSEPPHLGSRCELHQGQHQQKARLRQDAVDALWRKTVDGVLVHPPFLEELLRNSEWWDKACASVRAMRTNDSVFGDEAEYAVEWCIALAEQLVLAERATRTGAEVDSDQLDYVRGWVWERFANLDRGLRSNGLPRAGTASSACDKAGTT